MTKYEYKHGNGIYSWIITNYTATNWGEICEFGSIWEWMGWLKCWKEKYIVYLLGPSQCKTYENEDDNKDNEMY